ncbi:hypothetical protein BGZ91_006060 [Linnemannia elongata]|nr:hypothetical protein BGZ91_006060 [Linnemannia elongata]
MLSHPHAAATPDGMATSPGTTSTPESMVAQSTAAAKKKRKKKKKPHTTTTPRRTENHPPVENLTTAEAEAKAAEATGRAEAAAVAAKEEAGRAEAAAVAAKEAAGRAEAAAVAAKEAAGRAAKAATEAVVAVEAVRAAKAAAAEAVDAVEAAEESEAAVGEYEEYEQSKEEIARTTFLYVPVEGDIQVLPRLFARSEEILQWPYTEGHVLSVKKPYILTGFIRSFNFEDPINKRYSKIYGRGTAVIRGPAMIVNEDGRQILSLTKKDIPKIFR